MTAPLFELRSGELVGDGCHRPFSELVKRARKATKAKLVIFGKGERRVFDRLIASYPDGKFWQGRNGELVESVCRAVARYVENLDNWTDAELVAAQADNHEPSR